MKRAVGGVIGSVIVVGSAVWLVLAAMLVAVAARSLVLVVLWDWFVVPRFGVARLSLPAAGGLMTMAYLVVRPSGTRPRRESAEQPPPTRSAGAVAHDLMMIVVSELVVPLAALLIGWFFKRAMG